ncbi:hypothetical protein Phum_PHUM578640 [Pediculus humanus corporis]|uniref:Uncharacterized protein n=1 Tax=Pediculus humanus subsp. corporis TaxID=121224 RepID=E0W1K7_PEDHC|nr:uncharacterized protein Phum_PHUM578640 [Pediculus humanus corporis]EEB19513.1 hypothetical protein Phum_PHUM578640 [Pediculus humanus corporis]
MHQRCTSDLMISIIDVKSNPRIDYSSSKAVDVAVTLTVTVAVATATAFEKVNRPDLRTLV